MGAADWDIITGGSADVGHHEALHTAVPMAIPLSTGFPGVVKCRRIDNDNATEFGRMLFRYNREPTNFTVFKDASVRGYFAFGTNNNGTHVGIGCRMDTAVPSTVASAPGLFENGYYLEGYYDFVAGNIMAKLVRFLSGVGTDLWSLALPVAPGFYLWFGGRIDFLWQSDGTAILKVFTADPNAPEWLEQTSVVETPGVIPPYDGIGWGAQIEGGGAEFVNEAYVDLVEVYHG
ncbi:MAG: hypothetical protein HKO76_08760 [Acidimicrobiia bacterium]|nr:hypothetical protein [Acidimicrobiia bacterium]